MTFIRFLGMVKAHWYQTALLAVLLIVFVQFMKEHDPKAFLKSVSFKRAVFFLYLAFILVVTVFVRGTVADPLGNLFDNFWPVGWEEEENLLAFIPLGFLLSFAYRPQKAVKTAAVFCFCVSVFIELSQLVARLGSFQLSDLLYNTLGGVLGCGAYLLGARLIVLLSKCKWRERIRGKVASFIEACKRVFRHS